MKLIKSIHELRTALQREERPVSFVPTMGALHPGHLALVKEAAANNDAVVMSIFVNPLQFNDKRDYDAYPETLDDDISQAEAAGVAYLFLPALNELYPAGPDGMSTYIHVTKGVDVLCGAHRPGHFNGVATVVMKLLQIVAPERAYFGRKDAQQAAVVENMVQDYHVVTDIVTVPTVRESDGLAMSSRNVRLNPEERADAPEIYRALQKMKAVYEQDPFSPETGRGMLQRSVNGKVEYAEVRTYPELELPADDYQGKMLLACAVQYDHARLIDNIMWTRKEEEHVS
ncbi:pantoate--beta-alanine ligase [Alkalicoccus luteus]|uniref:Pantothenate synthetase n=1 Tax=Alkalicoccus luteus TaxID=1237094 RepID=A0A969PR80_9BACI|nr:pantoate--beta-alanine ligase [Alkalicoccus luteus]NJP38907.1 pantoate--beta-alanine ligase [Alkalicoccus luteus]